MSETPEPPEVPQEEYDKLLESEQPGLTQPPEYTGDPKTRSLRILVRGAYDIQKLRIQMGNRVTGNFKAKLGQNPGWREEELTKAKQTILDKLRAEYRLITEGLIKLINKKEFKGNPVMSTYTEFCLVHEYLKLEEAEKEHFKILGKLLEEYPVYTEFLSHVKGIGPAMGGVIVSEFNIHRAKYASSLVKYSGFDVGPDGKGRSKRKEHLVPREYIDKNGEKKIKDSITYNPFLKTKLAGVLGELFIKIKGCQYRCYYDQVKHRYENHAVYGILNDGKKDEVTGRFITSKARRHMMAKRYMLKMFLIDLYKAWRKLEGLPVHDPYHEAKLGFKHGPESPESPEGGKPGINS